ncbi:MAG: glycosyltransferase family 2 protein [bacterium]
MISVIIPTRNRKAFTKRCIESLLAQSLKPDEILVVDNASSDDTAVFLESEFRGQIQIIREDSEGVAAARNRGIACAQGKVLAFIDDDAVAHPDWLASMLKCLEETGADGAGGPALPVWEEPPPPYVTRSRKVMSYISAFNPGGGRRRLTGPRDFLIGTNCAFRKEVFIAGHRFHRIYSGSRRLNVGEDYEFSRRIAGIYPVFYDPAIIVSHYIPAFKMNLTYLARISFENGRMKAAIGGTLTPRGYRDMWGIDGWISVFSLAGYCYGRLGQLTGLAEPQCHP